MGADEQRSEEGAPVGDLARVAEATERFLGVVDGLSGDDTAGASLLPGWTVGHILTHVARNADGHVRRAEAAMRGEVVDQYPGGSGGRAAEIEMGAARPAATILEDLRSSSKVLAATWHRVPKGAWGGITRDVGGRERPLRVLPARRWQELEVHLVDLGVGPTYEDWPDAFVAVWLPHLEAGLADRHPGGHPVPDPGDLTPRERLAWLYGRLAFRGYPELAPWS